MSSKFKKYGPAIAFAIAAIAMVLVFPVKGRFLYNYQKGRPWMYETLISPIDFPILKTDSEILREKEEKASQIVDCYERSERIGDGRLSLFGRIAAETELDNSLASDINDLLIECYQAGIVSEFNSHVLSGSIVLVKDEKRLTEVPAQNIYTVESALTRIRSELAFSHPEADIDSLAERCHLTSLVAPNLTYDEGTTRLLHQGAVDYVSPTKGMIYDGQLIVSKGETVTADIEQLLDSYKAEYERSFGYGGSLWNVLFSHILLVAAMLAMFGLAILFIDGRIYGDIRRLAFLLLMAFISFLATSLLTQSAEEWLMAFPFAVLILYASSFFDRSISATTYLISLLPLLVIPDDGIELFLINAVAGGVVLLSFQRFNRGWKQFANVLFSFVAMMLVYVAFNMISDGDALAWHYQDIVKLAINAVLTIVCYPFVFLFEKIFSFVSYSRLWDLTDTNSDLLKMLSRRAPGTFQHCLQVANLAESAAREIGAAPMLTRVGSLYHDIGKMDNPSCFVENQTEGTKGYHSGLTPEASAHDILQHVPDGVTLAQRYGLPSVVTDFIRSHHGMSRAGYFYTQYCNEGGDPANVAPFTYDGALPETKEQAILMIADSVEAASRTLKDYSAESISELVDRIVASKSAEGQFDEADITIAEIGKVKASLKASLQQIYHGRISYPKRQGTTDKQ